jgi:all-trans-retinol 13,14-reductase
MEAAMPRTFDCIVIGSGLGGLTAGALCARAGLKVLVLERNANFGGAAATYRHQGLTIEASLHEIDGLDDGDPKKPLLRALDLERDLTFVDVGDLYEVRGGLLGEPFRLHHGLDAALAGAVASFPEHKRGLEEYFRRLWALRQAISAAALHRDDRSWWISHAPEALRHLWTLLRDGNATAGEVMTNLFGDDERVKMALCANLVYYHDDPDRFLFLRYAIPQASYIAGGGHYVRGGSKVLADRLAALIREAGGALESGREADEILLAGGKVAGVGHHSKGGGDRQIDEARLVLGNAAPQVLASMLPESKRQTFLAPYAGRSLSISLWTVSLGLSGPARDFGVGCYLTFIIPSWMQGFSQMRETAAIMGKAPGMRMPQYVFVDFHQIDSGLNAGPAYLASFCGGDRLENWALLDPATREARKKAWTRALINDIDRHFPGIADAVVYHEMSTAETMHEYLNTPGGAVYGFSPDTSPIDVLSSGPRTAIPGLWLSSAFTMGGGFTGSMMGGARAATAQKGFRGGRPYRRPVHHYQCPGQRVDRADAGPVGDFPGRHRARRRSDLFRRGRLHRDLCQAARRAGDRL